MKLSALAIVGITQLFLFSLKADFSGYYALTPQNGDKFGNWTRTGDITVDTTAIPGGLRLIADSSSSGSFTIIVPPPNNIYHIEATALNIQGEGSLHFYYGLASKDYSQSYPQTGSGGLAGPGDMVGFELRAGANSRTILDVLNFRVESSVPEPSPWQLLLVGTALLWKSPRAYCARWK